jgi:hypothetical protein
MSSYTKAPVWFLIVSILALLWNLMGLSAFYYDMTMTPERMADLPAEMHGYYDGSVPWWNWAGYGLAVIAGVLACIMLLMKKRWATLLFSLSLIGILIQNTWTFLFSDMPETMGSGIYLMPTLVIGLGILLLFLSKRAEREGWIA